MCYSMIVQYEPTIEELRHKYEVAMKEKMLVRLEKERLQARTEALEAQVPPPPPNPPTLSPFMAPDWHQKNRTEAALILPELLSCGTA